MDATTAVPLHFTLQTVSLASAGLLLAWAIVRARWTVALGAGFLAVAEALHAGRYLATDDEPALVVLRFLGVGLVLTVLVTTSGRRRLLLAGGSAAFVGGTLWGAFVGGDIVDFFVAPHVLIAGGSLALGIWAWLASRESIRLRVLTALVGILAVAIVAGGGAVSRVAALDKQNEELRQLRSAASAMRLDITQLRDGVAGRALAVSFAVGPGLSVPGGSFQVGSEVEQESIVVVDRGGRVRFSSGFHDTIPTLEDVRSSPALRSALAGVQNVVLDVVPDGLVIVGASPVFPETGPQTADRVVGAVATVGGTAPDILQSYERSARVALVDRDATSVSDPSISGIRALVTEEEIVIGRIATADGPAPAAAARIDPNVQLVVVGSDEGLVDAATGLLRALLIAILASAVLAVVVALWLSARVTRPILDLAEGAERVKADFLSSVSHELRTPLTPIRGYTELLRRGRVPARRAAAYLDEIGEAAGRLERIVTLLLDVAAMDAGRFRIDATDVRVDELLNDAATRWARDTGRDLQVTAARSLPRVHGDPDVLGHTLDELVDNAVKFSPDGGAVELRARRTGSGVEITVADQGIGVTEEQAEELTAAFTQADSGDRRRFGGLGLGLAYVSGALAAHSSRLTLDSAGERGSAFSFSLRTASMVTRMPARAGGTRTRGED